MVPISAIWLNHPSIHILYRFIGTNPKPCNLAQPLNVGRRAAYLALLHYPGGMQVGGGVTLENAVQYLDAGASHVIVTSYVFRDGRLDENRLNKLVHSFLFFFWSCISG